MNISFARWIGQNSDEILGFRGGSIQAPQKEDAKAFEHLVSVLERLGVSNSSAVCSELQRSSFNDVKIVEFWMVTVPVVSGTTVSSVSVAG